MRAAPLTWKDDDNHAISRASDLCYFVEMWTESEWSSAAYFKDDDNDANPVDLGMHKGRDGAKAACQRHADKLYLALGGHTTKDTQ
jgi:hypothetical protein